MVGLDPRPKDYESLTVGLPPSPAFSAWLTTDVRARPTASRGAIGATKVPSPALYEMPSRALARDTGRRSWRSGRKRRSTGKRTAPIGHEHDDEGAAKL